MQNSDFKIWINKKISEWVNTGRSETQFANEIGITQGSLNAWKNGSRPAPKQARIIDKLFLYFYDDPDIYKLFDRMPPPKEDPEQLLLSIGIPKSLAKVILAARAEVSEELASKGISMDSPESREIINRVFSKHGIHLTEIE